MAKTVRRFEFDPETREWKAVRVRAGERREEWGHENRKMARALRGRIKDYEEMVKKHSEIQNHPGSYHRPGSAS